MKELVENKIEELAMLQSLIYKVDEDMKVGNDNEPLKIMSKKILKLADQIYKTMEKLKEEVSKGDVNE